MTYRHIITLPDEKNRTTIITSSIYNLIKEDKKMTECSLDYHVSLYNKGYLKCPICEKEIEK